MKKSLFFITLVLFAIVFSYGNVYAENCTQFEFDDGGFPVHSITVNGVAWTSKNDMFDPNNGDYTIIVLAGKKGTEFPFLSTPGGLGTLEAIVNPDATGDNDAYKFTFTITNHNNGACDFIGGLNLVSGPEPTAPTSEVTSDVTITIKGEELEYHYVEDKPNEADVTYFKFDINGGTEEEHLVPFTFGNANYTYIDGKEPPKNVSQVTTKQPISYKYQYDGSGVVEFCVNGGGTDEYTSIKINGTEYSGFAPHTAEEYWETMNGWAQMFCIPNVPYSTSYNVVVEGRQTADENKIPGFGWSYLTKDRSTDIDEEGNFAHGRLEFVSAVLGIDQEEVRFSSINALNNYRYKGKGQIFQWNDGRKDYPEEDRRMAWGAAQIPYGTTLRVRIAPDKGYQLVSLAVSENGFRPTEIPGEYELELTRTNLSYDEDRNQFNLNPRFEKVDATAISESDAVSNVVLTITGNDNKFETGTPKLEVTDVASMSPERESDFDKATEEGYTINNYLEISLYNTLYKGGKKDGDKLDSWDTEIHELQDKATISLELEDALDGDDIQVIHEVRDEDKKIVGYDVIDAIYDQKKKTVTFETDGFSTYAIAVKENNQPDEEAIEVAFDFGGGLRYEVTYVKPGQKVKEPDIPENGDKVFSGFYLDEAFHDKFDFNTPITQKTILYAKWDDEAPLKNKEYTSKDQNGNIITFKEAAGHNFKLEITDYLTYTKEELMAKEGISSEMYDEVFGELNNIMKKYGDFIGFYNIEVLDESGHAITEGPFEIKIKITDKIKKYNTFNLVYLNDEMEVGEVIELKKDGDYLVGTLKHLSNYLLGGSIKNIPDVPKTGDNISTWIMVFIISVIVFTLSTTRVLKPKKIRINK